MLAPALSDDPGRVLVVGSGPTGAIAAATLVARGVPVTMLESGLHVPRGLLVRAFDHTIYRRWPARSSTRRHESSCNPDIHWCHELQPGGLSNFWTGGVPRFAPEDFYEGARLCERYRWPIGYHELLPYYQRIEALMQVSGHAAALPALPAPAIAYSRTLPGDWQRVGCAAERLGRSLTPMPLADGPPWLVTNRATAFNSFHRIVRRLRRSPRFTLLLGAHALHLNWSAHRRAVSSLTYYDRASRCQRELSGAAYVLAAGALASTKLLFDSTSAAFPTGLGNGNGLLGRYLHDHVHDIAELEVARPLTRVNRGILLTRTRYERSRPLVAGQATLNTGASRLDKLLQFTPVRSSKVGVVMFGTVIPRPENLVQPESQSTDEFGLPLLDIRIHYDTEELQNINELCGDIMNMLDMSGHAPRLVWRLPKVNPGTSAHYGGTIRMHASPSYGVLNALNRIYDAPNVAVVDASCFTTGVEKNPTLTAMAIAARAADRLAYDLKSNLVLET